MSLALGVGLLTTVLVGLAARWEWRRTDVARRGLRIVAVVMAGIALGFLGLSSVALKVVSDGETGPVTLVTDDASSITDIVGRMVDLGTAANDHSPRDLVPDVAFLRRTYPSVREFKIAGSGVTAADATALSGQRVTRVGTISVPAVPLIDVLTVPPEITLGSAVRVQGRVTGLTPGSALSVALEAPDGTVRTVEVLAGPDGRGVFSLDGGVPVATGLFEWRLRLGSRGEAVTLGVSVVQPVLPRILFWESAPSVESARLRRWLGEIDAAVAARVQVSADRVRTIGFDVGDLEPLSAGFLANFDLLVCDATAYAQFTGAELAALETAVRTGAMGLLVLAGETSITGRTEFPLPWSTIKHGADAENPEEAARRTRLRLFDGTALEESVGVANVAILEQAAGRKLAVDPLDRAVVVSFSHGRGQIAVSLVQDSWRWLQQGQGRTFAQFWTSVLSTLSRPLASALPWQLVGAGGPLFVDQPVRFSYAGADHPPEQPPVMITPDQLKPTPLAYETNGIAIVWPRSPGWHHLVAEVEGVRRSFYVQPPQALPAVRSEIRRRITDRLVVDSPAKTAPGIAAPDARFGLQGVAFLVFLVAVTGLWMEERWRRQP
ncbi:hypothetical protein MASR2M8_01410 [Opitutaceae bacterium]